MMSEQDLLPLMKTRHSGRLYDPNEVVNQVEINTLIEAARFSPSCFGKNLGVVLYVTSKMTKVHCKDYWVVLMGLIKNG